MVHYTIWFCVDLIHCLYLASQHLCRSVATNNLSYRLGIYYTCEHWNFDSLFVLCASCSYARHKSTPVAMAWLISINWIQDLGWHVESRSKYLNFLLLYACELFYLLSYECMQQQSLDCYSFFRLIDGNCSHRSLHHIYPVGTVLLYLFNIFVVIQFPVLLHFFNFFNFLWSSSCLYCVFPGWYSDKSIYCILLLIFS